jgi:hypothetical protein
MEYKIEKPNLSKISPKRMTYLNENKYNIFFKYDFERFSNDKYLYWDKIKFQTLPEELENHEELWYILKSTRVLFPIKVKDKV